MKDLLKMRNEDVWNRSFRKVEGLFMFTDHQIFQHGLLKGETL